MYHLDRKISASLALINLASNLLFPQAGWATFGSSSTVPTQEKIEMMPIDGPVIVRGGAFFQASIPDDPQVVAVRWTVVTAYSSTPDQTDSTPFITAAGTRVRDGIIACNFLKFGTRVRFPQLYGDKIFVVEDRMALKNSHKIDIWFPSQEQAKQFGVKWLKVEILGT